MGSITNHLPEITAVIGVIILLNVGRSKVLPKIRGSHHPGIALWITFAVTVVCGLMLGYALHGVISWMTHLHGGGSFFAYVGSIIAMILGWQSVLMLVALVRDLADGRPDEDARRAALLLPMFLPAGWAAVSGLISQPQHLGAGLVAAIMATITLVYVHRINGAALSGTNHRNAWKWFLVPVNILAGLVMIPLILFVDATLGHHIPGQYMAALRILGGLTGVGLWIAAVADITDRMPDKYVRAALAYGLPLLFLFGSLAVTVVHGGAGNGLQLLLGSGR
jgi:hypothetical protein